MNSNKRIAATMYSLGTLFVSGIYVQIMTIIIIIMIIIIIIIILNFGKCSRKNTIQPT
jgi:uncharacterized membrane protein